MCLACVAVLLGGCSSESPVEVRIIEVPQDEPTIADGIQAASPGDVVVVAAGTYFEHGIELKAGVELRSETGTPDCVTIDAQQQGAVLMCDGARSPIRIVGFTITGGRADAGMWQSGGAILCYESSLEVIRCVVRDNYVSRDGGGIAAFSSSVTLEGCEFVDNDAIKGLDMKIALF